MVSESKEDDEIYGSTLQWHPDYVEAIGMISIENANLENELSDLFSRVIGVTTRVGYAIYMTPKSAMAQVEILENAAKATFAPRKRGGGNEEHKAKLRSALKRTLSIAGRAKALIGKRHAIIHDSWGVRHGKIMRYKRSSPTLESRHVPLSELQTLVKDYRRLIASATALEKEFRDHPPSLIDLRLSNSPPEKR
jgi:hypothetical protein